MCFIKWLLMIFDVDCDLAEALLGKIEAWRQSLSVPDFGLTYCSLRNHVSLIPKRGEVKS